MKNTIKCIECGRINRPTKQCICDECLKEMNKPVKTGIIAFFVIIISSLMIYKFEFQVLWFIVGLLLGFLMENIIREQEQAK